MYRQIRVHDDNVRYQRILWRSNPLESVRTYELVTVTYGTVSAPFLAIRVLQKLVADDGSNYPLAASVIKDQTYVDDCLFGAFDRESALEIKAQLVQLLSQGGFNLRKWASNDALLLKGIDPSNHGLAARSFDSSEQLKMLGLAWNPESDSFCVKVSQSLFSVATKRTLLSTAARLFDPLGWIAPVVVSIKILLQKLWLGHCDWDESVPEHILSEWERFQREIFALEEITLPRWTGYNPTRFEIELHGFCDASTKAYAAVIYVRLIAMSGSATLSILAAKSKVAPIKTVSVPRLELCAAHLLIKFLSFVKTSLNLPAVKCYCWTDSTIVLHWISQPPSRWNTIVANRVIQIQDGGSTVIWKHVSTRNNPADCASRGLMPAELQNHQLWWSGPSWLADPASTWPESNPVDLRSPVLEEQRIKQVDRIEISVAWDV